MEEWPALVTHAQALGRRVGFPLTREEAFAIVPAWGPLDLLFADSGVRDEPGFAALVGLPRAGGRIVMDDMTPQCSLPPGSPLLDSDRKRRFFHDSRLVSAEVVLPDLENSLLVGTRMT